MNNYQWNLKRRKNNGSLPLKLARPTWRNECFFLGSIVLKLLKQQDVLHHAVSQTATFFIMNLEAGKTKMHSLAERVIKSLLNNKMFYNSVLSAHLIIWNLNGVWDLNKTLCKIPVHGTYFNCVCIMHKVVHIYIYVHIPQTKSNWFVYLLRPYTLTLSNLTFYSSVCILYQVCQSTKLSLSQSQLLIKSMSCLGSQLNSILGSNWLTSTKT